MYDLFNNRMKLQGRNVGEALKRQSDKVMDATFTNDVAYRKCYLQDKDVIFPEQTLAGYKKAKAVFNGKEVYNPQKLMGFEPIDAKYQIHTYVNISSDQVDYYLQFRPLEHGRNPNVRVDRTFLYQMILVFTNCGLLSLVMIDHSFHNFIF